MKSVKLKAFFKSVGVIYCSAFFTHLSLANKQDASLTDLYKKILPALFLAKSYDKFGVGKPEQLLSNFAAQTFFTVGAYKLSDVLNFDTLNKQAVATGALGALGAAIKVFISKDCLKDPIEFFSDTEKRQHALVDIFLKATAAAALVYINSPTIDCVEEDLLEPSSLLDGVLDF